MTGSIGYMAKPKLENICTICGDSFFSAGRPARHKCQGEFKGRTGTGVLLDELPEIPELEISESDIDIQVEEEIPDQEWRPAGLEVTSLPDIDQEPPPEDEPERIASRGRQDPPATKKDRSKMEDLVLCYMAALDGKRYSMEEKTVIISGLFSDTLDLRVETAQMVMSQTQFAVLSAIGIALLLGKDQIRPVLENTVKGFSGRRQPDIADPFGE